MASPRKEQLPRHLCSGRTVEELRLGSSSVVGSRSRGSGSKEYDYRTGSTVNTGSSQSHQLNERVKK